MPTGIVKKFFEDKGFGFITPDDGSDDVFVHRAQCSEDRSSYLEEGDEVTYEVEWNDQKGKYSASSCSGFKSGNGGGGGGNYGGKGGGSYGGGYGDSYGGGGYGSKGYGGGYGGGDNFGKGGGKDYGGFDNYGKGGGKGKKGYAAYY